MTDILDQNLQPSKDAFSQGVADETVLLQVRRGVYFGMDPVGTAIWNGLQQGRAPREICAAIAQDFDVPVETVETDTRAFLEELTANDIVTVN